ncbi:sodium-independent sulfate anion transporter-like [Osmia bicornis bicornis]|uniref:sodium-independent sulfate anion transporter-like n=1 Tax=Osmia bicornis bicornis TaxID=1437191 RepID=UPI0010F46597|nr:sodium-independent sulfate anion transporter-like [Osmia bicornis bicornis]XP_029039365.1 sodium-independent sulfate anion transporter-like [Osmia bicornis bicornis]XP_029039366.1 sodium-independent sulfate anion transporter-like [Osmia bicornis bicornis]XP_029039367.1 sodium-independent sulfate anion transporter-like [Osmia bicornis bicornis]XP_029039368.1 sodium-independent sulfate anion transporter-like [Osmia bicornis bicornis]XP_029039369.1 sodium-independent sulfate anion transporter-
MTGLNFKRLLKNRVPILKWLPLYRTNDAFGDLVAGFTVGLTLIPQAIAYAGLAGLTPQYGLYSAFAGSFVYIIFGTCREVNIGPTALISLLTYTYARGIPEYAILLCFLSGCVTIVLGILRLGFLVEFVSIPVVSGFTSAASVIIACSQIKNLLGLKIHGESFIEIWRVLASSIGQTRIPDLILSSCCILTLLTLKKVKDLKVSNEILGKSIWFLGTGRNALVVILCAVVSYVYEGYYGGAPFILTGHIDSGLPSIAPPSFTRTVANQTETFFDICKDLGSGIVIVPLISIIGNVAIAKAFSRGQSLDATQEMLTLGLCNIVGSFFQSMPVTGSFSRSAVNNASGVRTPLGGIYTGVLVVLALSLLTPYFYYIPRATLSSVIVCAVIFMVEVQILRPIWKCSKRDLIPTFATFFACLFAGVEIGILIGVTIDLAILIYFNARPTIYIEYRNTPTLSYILVQPSAGLLFPAVEYLRIYLLENLAADQHKLQRTFKNSNVVVLDCKHIDKIDYTAATGLNMVMRDFKEKNHNLILLRPSKEVLRSIQSLSEETIRVVNTDAEMIAALKEWNTIKRTREIGAELLDMSNGKPTSATKNEHTSTKL